MTRVLIVADSGVTMAALTEAVTGVKGAHIVRYGNSRTRLERLLPPVAPDVIVIGDLRTAADALLRLSEIRRSAPSAKVVLVGDGPRVEWIPDALRAQAAAVLPGNIAPHAVTLVLTEVITERGARAVPLRPRAQHIERTHEGRAA